MSTGTPQGYKYLSPNQDQPDVVVNENFDILDRITGGLLSFMWPTDADYTLATGTTPPEWQYATIFVRSPTGFALTADRNLICPPIGKSYVIANGTTRKITLRTTVTGKLGITVNADRIEHLMSTVNGNVFPVAGQVSLTPPT